MFGTSLAGEYEALMQDLDFTRDEILGLIQGAADSSWLTELERHALRASLA